MYPQQEMTAQDNLRKRVCKACDRCRLKKSKCDGVLPCSRCKTDNQVCEFGERKKSQDKVYPKGYVEMLERNQTLLVKGIQKLYHLSQPGGGGWSSEPLLLQRDGQPLTHDILARLDLLHISEDGDVEHFEGDFDKMQSNLVERGAPMSVNGRRGSSSSTEDHTTSGSSPTSNITISSAHSRSTSGYMQYGHGPGPMPVTPPSTLPSNSPFLGQSQLGHPKAPQPLAPYTMVSGATHFMAPSYGIPAMEQFNMQGSNDIMFSNHSGFIAQDIPMTEDYPPPSLMDQTFSEQFCNPALLHCERPV